MVTSVAGVAVYSLPAATDWWLGGLAGMYLGAACQRHVPQQVLRGALGVLLAGLGGFYLL